MLLAQNGFGKGDLIRHGIRDGLIDGVVLSPRDEGPEKLREHVGELRATHGDTPFLVFDPQFYALTIAQHRLGSLPEFYEDVAPGLSRADLSAPRKVRPTVERCLRLQHELGLSRLIAPSVLIPSFRDPWSQIALSMSEIAIETAATLPKAAPLLISLIVDENALLSRDALDEYLDIVTGWQEIRGFYLVVRPNDAGFPAIMQEGAIAGLLYLVHVLATINGFEVVAGYSDLFGTLLHAAGATHTASGWFNSLRQFSLARFQPAGGGRQPRPRYTSGPLLTPILIIPELETIQRIGSIGAVLSGTPYDAVFASGPVGRANWPKPQPQFHHWATLRKLAEHVKRPKSAAARMDAAALLVAGAGLLFDDLRRQGVGFEVGTGGRQLPPWLRGVEGARAIL